MTVFVRSRPGTDTQNDFEATYQSNKDNSRSSQGEQPSNTPPVFVSISGARTAYTIDYLPANSGYGVTWITGNGLIEVILLFQEIPCAPRCAATPTRKLLPPDKAVTLIDAALARIPISK